MKRFAFALLLLALACKPADSAQWWKWSGTVEGQGILPTVVRLDTSSPLTSSMAPSGSPLDMSMPTCFQTFLAAPKGLSGGSGTAYDWDDLTIVWPWRYQSGTAVREYFTPRMIQIQPEFPGAGTEGGTTYIEYKLFVRLSNGTIDSTQTGLVTGWGPLKLKANGLIFAKVRTPMTTPYVTTVLYW